MNWYVEVLKKYAVFTGRARRKEYWFFVLFNIIASILISIVDIIIGTNGPVAQAGILYSLYSLGVFIPSVAVTVRRLHDTNRSGWWALLPVLLIIGGIVMMIVTAGTETENTLAAGIFMNMILMLMVSLVVLFVFMLLDSTPGDNRYGPNPKNSPEPSLNAKQSPQDNHQRAQIKTGDQVQAKSILLHGVGSSASPITLFPGNETIVGRSSRANILLDDQYVSGEHLSIELNARNEVMVKDLGSTNGTYIDGIRLEPYASVVLERGQRLIVGSEDVIYTL